MHTRICTHIHAHTLDQGTLAYKVDVDGVATVLYTWLSDCGIETNSMVLRVDNELQLLNAAAAIKEIPMVLLCLALCHSN